jgi:hypothetical protein
MMLVLAVRTDAPRVYERALAFFTPDEIAEAFAAARGIASPSQLRSMLKRDGRDLVAEFRAMGPARRPISLQRWGPRRIVMALAAVGLAILAVTNVYGMLTPAELPIDAEPTCGTGDVMILMAQAVPTATAVPCVAALPAGWSVGPLTVRRGDAHFWLDSDRAGGHAVDVRLRGPGACAVDELAEVPSDEASWRRFDDPDDRAGDGRPTRTYVAAGACVRYEFDLDGVVDDAVIADLDIALGFQPRGALVEHVARRSDLVLCGVEAPACTGGGS